MCKILGCSLILSLLCCVGAQDICDTAAESKAAESLLQRTQQRGKHPHPQSSTHSQGGEHPQSHGPRFNNAFSTAPPGLLGIPETMLSAMILPSQYPCDLQFPEDWRFKYCGSPTVDLASSPDGCKSLCGWTQLSEGLHPLRMSQTSRWLDSLRLLMPIGALPCCPSAPHCRAPVCKVPSMPVPEQGLACTKSDPVALYGFMTHPQVWPAYFAKGGSFDLDVEKHWDVLTRLLGVYEQSIEPFDITIDLGADWGSFTERFSARKFAKDFIVLDAVPGNRLLFDGRMGNASYLQRWYSEQVVAWPQDKPLPQFEMLSFAISNKSEGTFDMCDGGTWHLQDVPPCPVPIMSVDDIFPSKLSPVFQDKFHQAQSAYLKLDLDGMDQLGIDGMRRLLSEVRGVYEDGNSRHMVNFMMLEFCPQCIKEARETNQFAKYDLGTLVQLFESLDFELFMIGPHYVPLSHGSWIEQYNTLFSDTHICPAGVTMEHFKEIACPNAPETCELDECMFAADLFAMRASHPRATEVKVALGACTESREFDPEDESYVTIPTL